MTSLWNTSVWWLANNLSLVLCGDTYIYILGPISISCGLYCPRQFVDIRFLIGVIGWRWSASESSSSTSLQMRLKMKRNSYYVIALCLWVCVCVCVYVQKLANASLYLTIYIHGLCKGAFVCVDVSINVCLSWARFFLIEIFKFTANIISSNMDI